MTPKPPTTLLTSATALSSANTHAYLHYYSSLLYITFFFFFFTFSPTPSEELHEVPLPKRSLLDGLSEALGFLRKANLFWTRHGATTERTGRMRGTI